MESIARAVRAEISAPVIQGLGAVLMFTAMFFVVGGHWAVMQTFAWATMINTYSMQTGSLSAGIEKTFSGKAPCEKCKKIDDARQKEQKIPDSIKAEKTSEIFLALHTSSIPLPRCKVSSFPPVKDFQFPLRGEEPPSPVPLQRRDAFRYPQAI